VTTQSIVESARMSGREITRGSAVGQLCISPGHTGSVPTDAALLRLLRSLDDPKHLEWPKGYRHHRVRARFEELVQRIDDSFDCRCDVDRNVQDASLHGRIDIPAAATRSGSPLVIGTSNFGDLALMAVDNFDVWSDADTAELLHPDDAHRIRGALADLGYTLIPDDLIYARYDGPSAATAPIRCWFDRYFSYM
jgi:hypothetical protein